MSKTATENTDNNADQNNEKKTKKKGNFENLEDLAAEYQRGKMPEKKAIALRKKLVSLFRDGKIINSEQKLMEQILRKERAYRTITPADNYLLNTIEASRCKDVAIVKSEDIPSVLHLVKDLECRYRFDELYDDGKGKDDSIGRYYVYVPRTIPTRHQLKISTVQREIMGHPVDESEYPDEKTVTHLLVLKVKEFKKWFEEVDPDVLDSDSKEEEQYQF